MQEELRNTNIQKQLCNSQNSDAIFLLRRVTQNGKSVQILADFSPAAKNPQDCQSENSLSFSTLPSFNKDGKFFTPSFMLQEDKINLSKNTKQCETNHWKKVQQFVEQKHELFVPKPSKANRFCLICKQNYDDYLTHISTPSHKKIMKSSAFYDEILRLCQKISPRGNQKLKKKIMKQKRKKQGSKTSQRKMKNCSQKLSETLSTGLQWSQEGHNSVSIK